MCYTAGMNISRIMLAAAMALAGALMAEVAPDAPDAKDAFGVTFELDCSTPGWADVEFVSSELKGVQCVPRAVRIHAGRHAYLLNGHELGTWSGTNIIPRNEVWRGRISGFRLKLSRTGAYLPLASWRVVREEPSMPPDIVVNHARAPAALMRAGQPAPLDASVRNLGNRILSGLSCDVAGLPEGVRLVDAAKATHVEAVSGGETVLHRVEVLAERPVSFTARLTFSGAGVAPHVAEIPVEIGPSLGLAPADYPPPPKPLKGKYEIGAYYFPAWSQNWYWALVWGYAPERRPALGWSDISNPAAIDWQIKWAVENGISFFLVDWYWLRGRHGLSCWERGMPQARYRDCIKWAVMWANHTPKGTHSVEDQRNVTRYWIDNFFCRSNYYRIDGKPVVCIWDGRNLDRDMGGRLGDGRKLLDISREMARAAGYGGITFICMRFPEADPSKGPVEQCAARGYDMTTTYHYLGDGGLAGKPAPRDFPYEYVAKSSPGHWRARHATGILPDIPNLSTGWDDRPWNDASSRTGRTVRLFREICREARRFADESGTRRFILAPINEWGEGSYAEPNAEFGFGMFETVRDAFFEKPAGGWPLNFTPADIGLGNAPFEVPHQLGAMVTPTWDFTDGGLHGWRMMMGAKELRGSGEGVVIDSTSDDPAIDANVSLAAIEFKTCVVRMKVSPGAKGPVRLFWAGASGRTHTHVQALLPIVADGRFHDYVFPLGDNRHWCGFIRRLRFDPCESPGIESVVSSIRLLP